MFENYFKKTISLGEKEEVQKVVNHHPITFFGTGVKIFLPVFIFLAALIFAGSDFLKTILGSWVFSLILFVLLLVWATASFYHWYIWYFDAMILTNKRIIVLEQKGLFEKKITEALYEKIQDITVDYKGAAQTIFRFGAIIVQTAGESPNLKITDIRKPQQISRIIVALKDQSTEKENLNKEK